MSYHIRRGLKEDINMEYDIKRSEGVTLRFKCSGSPSSRVESLKAELPDGDTLEIRPSDARYTPTDDGMLLTWSRCYVDRKNGASVPGPSKVLKGALKVSSMLSEANLGFVMREGSLVLLEYEVA